MNGIEEYAVYQDAATGRWAAVPTRILEATEIESHPQMAQGPFYVEARDRIDALAQAASDYGFDAEATEWQHEKSEELWSMR